MISFYLHSQSLNDLLFFSCHMWGHRGSEYFDHSHRSPLVFRAAQPSYHQALRGRRCSHQLSPVLPNEWKSPIVSCTVTSSKMVNFLFWERKGFSTISARRNVFLFFFPRHPKTSDQWYIKIQISGPYCSLFFHLISVSSLSSWRNSRFEISRFDTSYVTKERGRSWLHVLKNLPA